MPRPPASRDSPSKTAAASALSRAFATSLSASVEGGAGLGQGRLEGLGLERRDHLAGLHPVALAPVHLGDDSVDERRHGGAAAGEDAGRSRDPQGPGHDEEHDGGDERRRSPRRACAAPGSPRAFRRFSRSGFRKPASGTCW